MRSHLPPAFAAHQSPARRFVKERLIVEASLGAGHPLVGVLSQLEFVFEQMLVVTAAQVAGVVLFSGNLGLSVVVAGAVVQVGLGCALALLALRRRQLCLELIVEGHARLPLACVRRVRRRLLDPRTLEQLARWVDELVELAAATTPGAARCRPLCEVRVIRPVTPELRQIASLLRGPGPSVRGVALAEWILTSPATPLYGSCVEALRRELGRARYLLMVRQ
jgi:hypothetical protein